MSNNKLPARVDTHLPLAQLPVNPPTFTTALNAHVRMKVSEVLQKRMNAIALLRLDFQRTQVSIG